MALVLASEPRHTQQRCTRAPSDPRCASALKPLEDHCNALAASDTHGGQAILALDPVELMNTFGGDDEAEQEAISNQQTQQTLQTLGDVITIATQSGVDPNLVFEMPVVKQVLKNPGLDINAAFNFVTSCE